MKIVTYDNLSGKFLIASPFVLAGDVFHKTIIYVMSHTTEGAAGLIINYRLSKSPADFLLKLVSDKDLKLSDNIPVHLGGPVQLERGFLLHTNDYSKNTLFEFTHNLALSSNQEILDDMANGLGPKHSLFAIGYTKWDSNQLEEEIAKNLWIAAEADTDLIFNEKDYDKWHSALSNIGINEHSFSKGIARS